jgi:hypothetical protein
VLATAVHKGAHALISASDLRRLLVREENRRLQRLRRRAEQRACRLQRTGRRQGAVVPCCRPPLRVRSHALHAAAAE